MATLPFRQAWFAWVQAMEELSSRLHHLKADIQELSPEDREGGVRAHTAIQENDSFIADSRVLLGCKNRFSTALESSSEPDSFEINEDEYRLLRAFLIDVQARP
jgi:hypothetical protein